MKAQSDSTLLSKPPLSNWRSVIISADTDTVILDSQSVFPNSVSLYFKNKELSDSCYLIEGNKLIFLCTTEDSIYQADFRVFPYKTDRKIRHKNSELIGKSLQHDGLIGTPYTYNPFGKGNDAFNFGNLDYNGVFARGISLGNSQDLILNSNFNLQVAGKLGDIEIIAAISDNNVPLQPEGNTQQLQDFDRIFVQFKYKKQSLIAGDYNIKRPEGSYFMNYYRRLQGGQLLTDIKLGKKGRLKTDASFAISKGKFASNVFPGEEGNQGPYRLRGSSGEQFIIIIAGTERVFIDGKQLVRGADNDYIIDYNTGELIFTPHQFITKDKRIQVEFSYSDFAFLRTLATANTSYETKKSKVRFNFYSEQDAKGQTLTESLSDSAKAVLQRVGDQVDQAFVSGITIPDPDAENTGTIFYKLTDTIVNSLYYDSILVFSNNPDSAIYSAKFAAISSGGNYIRTQGNANGVVYQWVAPDQLTGLPTGTHEPIQLLATPKQRQLFNLGMDYNIGNNGTLSADIALSNVDLNTFSDIGNEDNQGIAARLSFNHSVPLFWTKPVADSSSNDTIKSRPNNFFSVKAHYEYLMKEFEFIEPYRTREFARDWNINTTERTQEHLYNALISLSGTKWGNVSYQFSGLNKESQYEGYRHNLNVNSRFKGLNVISKSSLTQTETDIEKSIFVRPNLDLSYTFKKFKNLKIGAYAELEQNQRRNISTDTLDRGSFFYHLFKIYTDLPVSDKLNLHVHFNRRYDYTPQKEKFEINAIADELNLSGEWIASKASRLKWNLNYRNLSIEDSLLTTQEAKETYLGRLEYILNIKKGFIRSNTIYQLGSGQQQKIEYNFVKVDIGQGSYVWNDRNEDGVEQTNEFDLSNFQDQGEYIRYTIFTGDYIRTNNVLFSQSLIIRPKILIRSNKKRDPKKKLAPGLDFLQRFSTRSIFKIDRKTFDKAKDVVPFNPFQLDVADTALVSVSSGIQNNLFFNRTGIYSFEFGQRDSRSKTLLSTGFETRSLSEYQLRQRLNIKPGSFKRGKNPAASLRNLRLQAQLTGVFGYQGNQSEFNPERNFNIEYYRVEPQFSFMFKNFLRVILKYNFKYKENKIGDLELLRSHDVTTEITYSKTSKTNIQSSFSIVQMQYNGNPTSSVGYTMTEGLQSGSNFLWKISFSQALSRNIQMTISYEGRKTGDDAPVVHVGRAEIRANF